MLYVKEKKEIEYGMNELKKLLKSFQCMDTNEYLYLYEMANKKYGKIIKME